MLENDAEKTDKVHARIFQTYRDLQKMLPKSLFKMRVNKAKRYPVKIQPLINKIEQERNQSQLSLLTPKVGYKKNIILSPPKSIFIISREKQENGNRCLTFEKLNEPKKSFRTLEKNHHYKIKIKNNNNFNNLRKYTLLGQKSDNNSQSNLSHSIIEEDCPRNDFKPKYVNDYIMKNNIYLPSIIDRMKQKKPRGERQISGLVLKGKNSHSLYENNNTEFLKRNLAKIPIRISIEQEQNDYNDNYNLLYNNNNDYNINNCQKSIEMNIDNKTISTNTLFNNEFFENIKIVRFNKVKKDKENVS